MRDFILEKLYYWSKKPYQKWFKTNQPWTYSTLFLLSFSKGTIGHDLGFFLKKNQFQLEDKLENHDVFHVLTQTGISVPEEISMQFYLFGNGKKSLYLFLVIFTGTILYPEKTTLFKTAYQKGKEAYPFHHLSYKHLLHLSTSEVRRLLNICPNSFAQTTNHHTKLLTSKLHYYGTANTAR